MLSEVLAVEPCLTAKGSDHFVDELAASLSLRLAGGARGGGAGDGVGLGPEQCGWDSRRKGKDEAEGLDAERWRLHSGSICLPRRSVGRQATG